MIINIQIDIIGRVQGVFFRDFVVHNARSLGLRGYVKNMPDGSLRIEAEGESDRIDSLIELVRHGPKDARVSKVDIKPGSLKNFPSFESGYGSNLSR